MKIKLFGTAFFLSAVLSAQTVIVDKNKSQRITLANFQYLPKSKKMMIYSSSRDPSIGQGYYLDADGEKTVFFEPEKNRILNPVFSRTEKSYRTAILKSGDIRKSDYIFVIDGKEYTLTFDQIKDVNFKYFGVYNVNNVLSADWAMESDFSGSFNDAYIFGFTNPKGGLRIDFEEKDVYLEMIEIKTGIKKRVKLEKPDMNLLKGDLFAKSNFDLTFSCRLKNNDNFDLITKSLSNDSQTTVLYKAEYNFEGKKLKTVPFTLKLDQKYFITSNNGGGDKYVLSSPGNQGGDDIYALDVLSINNYFEDRENGDLYIYGLFSDEMPKKINDRTHPKGFYVFKFDKDGNKLWESINYIDGKDYFEKVSNTAGFQLNLLEYNNDLIFSASVNSFTEFTNAAVINKASGHVLKSSFVEYNNNLSHGVGGRFSKSTFDSKELKNKSFSQISFAAIGINPKVMDYLKGIPDGGKRLHFETIFSEEGIWLLETDDDTYYKVIIFKD